MAAIKDVAKLAGMSVAVVSKYLKNADSVRKDTKERIESAINTLHYIPSPIARSLRTKRTGMIAIVVPSITNPFFAEIFETVCQACAKESMLAILQTAENQEEMDQTIQSIRLRQIDGVVLCFLDQEQFLVQLKAQLPAIPITIMNWHEMETADGNIVLDVKRGIFDTTTHLIRQGCSKIGYIGGSKESVISKEKFNGFISALEQAEMQRPSAAAIRQGKANMRHGYDAMQEIYETDPSVQAIVCENDALAIGCITYCLHHQIEIPKQLQITGFDDIPLAAMFEPQITTVHLPIREMGQCAVKMIRERLEGAARQDTIVFDTQLIVRKTT